MNFNNQKGKVSIFLCIILIPMVALAGILVDASRIHAGAGHVEKACEVSAYSLLAGYGSILKDEYGLFALDSTDPDSMKERFRSYLEKNLMIRDENGLLEGLNEMVSNAAGTDAESRRLDLYRFRVEDIHISALYNLTENEVVRSQLLQFMKYRAPKEMVEVFWSKLSMVKETGKMNEAFRRKMNVEKLMAKVDKSQQELKKSLDGDGSGKKFVNGFNHHDARSQCVDQYVNTVSELLLQVGELDSLYSEIDLLHQEIAELSKEEEKSEDRQKQELESLKDQLKEKEDEKSGLEDWIQYLKSSVDELYQQLLNDHTALYIKPNTDAEGHIREIMEIGKDAEAAIEDLKTYIEEHFQQDDVFSKDFSKGIRDDLNHLNQLLLHGREAEKLLRIVERNRKALEEAIRILNNIHSGIGNMESAAFDSAKTANELNRVLQEYHNQIHYDYGQHKSGSLSKDPREDKVDVGRLLDGNGSIPKGVTIPPEALMDLPSRKKVVSAAVPEETGMDGHEGKIDFMDGENAFSDDALSFANRIGNGIAKELLAIRDELYINEYIMGTFKNSVSQLETPDGIRRDKDLKGRDKSLRNTFFFSEAEYVLKGEAEESANRKKINGQLLALRFAMNTVHVYADSAKRNLAWTMATAAAGWWTGGAGIPIIASLIICAWGMAEAVKDLEDLLNGKAVPFYKSGGDWKTDLGIANSGPKTASQFCFTYHDYLRLFLLLMNPDKKISRIEDLIQLNLSKNYGWFRMSDWNTCLRVEAVVSTPYFFLNSLMVPKHKKTSDGRHLIKVVAYEMY